MKLTKAIAGMLCLIMTIFSLSAQEREERTVEEEYLSTVEDVIIKELAEADDQDSKWVALQYLETAVDDGRTTPDMHEALDSLAGEGIFTQERTAGRLSNNFPDIRAKACDILAKMGTEEAKNTLLKVAIADNEPMVASAAIRGLGEIGINDNDEVVEAISWAHKRYVALNPTSSLAFEVLVAFEKLSSTVENKGPMIQTISAIATNYRYVTPVREYALQVLDNIRGQ